MRDSDRGYQRFDTAQNSALLSTDVRSKRWTDRRILDFQIESGGKNVSTGQKQLICIARALVRRPKLLLMDEATSSIDQRTDRVIQNLIRREFRDATIGTWKRNLTPVTIAHRLRTVMHYDQVFVLDQGRVSQSGSPRQLLETPGAFRQMVGAKLEQFRKMLESDHRSE